MKFPFAASLILLFFASCQEAPKTNDYLLRQKITAEEYKARIKAEKKRQADLDLPYRMLSGDEKIESLAFIPGTDREPVWAQIEKNRPTLAVLLTDSGVSALDPAYRSVREKVPFMAIPREFSGSRSDFVRSWPYVKSVAENQNAFYHALSFGEKKDALRVIMIDSTLLTEDQWKWIADELKNNAAVSVLVSAKPLNDSERERFQSLVKKSKQKSIIWLTTGIDQSKISKTTSNMASIYELNARSAKIVPAVLGDAPMQITKPAEFGILKFDWQNRVAVFEIRNAADEKVETLVAKF